MLAKARDGQCENAGPQVLQNNTHADKSIYADQPFG
jgi:hypothetical protein